MTVRTYCLMFLFGNQCHLESMLMNKQLNEFFLWESKIPEMRAI